MKMKAGITKKNYAFTLIEVLVAMTILSIVMVSILMIYALSVEISLKTDINREMQQNIKSVIETIAEDTRRNSIVGVSQYTDPSYTLVNPPSPQVFVSMSGSSLQIGDNYYFLADAEKVQGGDFDTRIDESHCDDIKQVCVLVKKGVGPLTNSKISFKNLTFYVSGGKVPKVTIMFTARAAIKNGVRADIIKDSLFQFQTTISERSLQIK